MKIREIFTTALNAGVENDPSKTEGKWSEFKDSNILFESGNREIRRTAVGIDIESEEILVISELKSSSIL